jgi:hypothetical protein
MADGPWADRYSTRMFFSSISRAQRVTSPLK